MKRALFLLILILAGTFASAQKKVATDTTRNKTSDTKITPGASGVRRSIGYKFSSVAAETDPGNGIFRYNSSNISSVKWIIVDNIDISGEDQTNWYSTWDKSTGATGRGSINIVGPDGKNMNLFNITGVFVKADGYWKIPVEYISGNLPANGIAYYYVFNRIAHKKPEPAAEPQVTQPPKPVTDTKPVTEPQPVTEPKPEPVAQPLPQPKPEPVLQPVAEPKPEPLAEPVTQPQPEPAPPAQTARTRQTTREADARKPAQTTQPAQATRPSQTVQTTQAKPAAQTTQPANQTQPAAQQPTPVQQTQPVQTARPAQPARNVQNYEPAPYNQVSNVKKPVDIPNPYANANLTGPARRKWYRGIIELGYGLGVGEYGINNFRFNFINGIMIGKVSSIGLGIGYRRYCEKNFSDRTLYSPQSQIPVFLDLRTSFTRKKITPYLALGIGGSASYVKVNSDSTASRQEGLYFCPSGGIWFNVSDRFAVFAGAAYELQRLEYVLISDDSRFKKNTGSVSLNIGIAF